MLKEGVDYEIVKDGTGYGYKYAILDSEIWAPKEGIVEIKRLKTTTVDGRPKNDDEVIIKRYKTEKQDYYLVYIPVWMIEQKLLLTTMLN